MLKRIPIIRFRRLIESMRTASSNKRCRATRNSALGLAMSVGAGASFSAASSSRNSLIVLRNRLLSVRLVTVNPPILAEINVPPSLWDIFRAYSLDSRCSPTITFRNVRLTSKTAAAPTRMEMNLGASSRILSTASCSRAGPISRIKYIAMTRKPLDRSREIAAKVNNLRLATRPTPRTLAIASMKSGTARPPLQPS